MALMDAGEFSLLVCGGSALNLVGLVERPTRDVDVLGIVKAPGNSVRAKPTVVAEELPEEIARAAAAVALEMNLAEDWLNDSALDVQRLGLPPRILERTHRQEFGPCLTVLFIGRQDQVALKLYAALNKQKDERHLKDLLAIQPTRPEMEFAVRWLFNRRTSQQFRDAVCRLVEGMGFAKLRAFRTTAATKFAITDGVSKGKPRSRSGKRRR